MIEVRLHRYKTGKNIVVNFEHVTHRECAGNAEDWDDQNGNTLLWLANLEIEAIVVDESMAEVDRRVEEAIRKHTRDDEALRSEMRQRISGNGK